MSRDSTTRFSSRVEAYIRARPGYPDEVITLIRDQIGLPGGATVADIGSGTGIFSELLLRHGYRVIGVEPNREMREAGARLLSEHSAFETVEGTAEATGLADHSVDLVTAAQAFHWFEPVKARQECARILRPGGQVLLVWNRRLEEGSDFLVAYEALLREFGTDYEAVNHVRTADPEAVAAFFAPATVESASFRNVQQLSREGLVDRALSSSYVPGPGHPRYDEMLSALDKLFAAHEDGGVVAIEYRTEVSFGTLDG